MKVTECKVRTSYSIELTTRDMARVLHEYADKESMRICYKSPAFDGINPETVTVRALIDLFEHGLHMTSGHEFTVIAKVMGFDGWLNAGYYDNNKRVYKMVVYNDGDTLGMPL